MRLLFLFIPIIIILGCQEAAPPLSEKKMADVLTDLHLAEALGQISPIDSGGYMIKNRDSIYEYYQYIFDANEVNAQEFNTGLDWYGEHPNQFEKIYDQVLGNLSTIKEEKMEKSDEIPSVTDSTFNDNYRAKE